MGNPVQTADNTPNNFNPETSAQHIFQEIFGYVHASGDLRTLFYRLENGVEEYENLELSRYHMIDIEEDENVIETVDILDLDTFDASEDMSQVWENATEIQRGTLLHLYPHEVFASLGIQIESSTTEVQEFIEGLLAEDADLITSPSMLPVYLDALLAEREDLYPLEHYGDLAKYRKGGYVRPKGAHFSFERVWLSPLSWDYPLNTRFPERFVIRNDNRKVDLWGNSSLGITQFWYRNFDSLTAVLEGARTRKTLAEQVKELGYDPSFPRIYAITELQKVVTAIGVRCSEERVRDSLGVYSDLEQYHYDRYHRNRAK